MMLLRRFSVAVVVVVLMVWKRPVVPKVAPPAAAFSSTVLKDRLYAELAVAEVTLIPRIASLELAAGARRSPTRLS